MTTRKEGMAGKDGGGGGGEGGDVNFLYFLILFLKNSFELDFIIALKSPKFLYITPNNTNKHTIKTL